VQTILKDKCTSPFGAFYKYLFFNDLKVILFNLIIHYCNIDLLRALTEKLFTKGAKECGPKKFMTLNPKAYPIKLFSALQP
jgi:hypothetical protein